MKHIGTFLLIFVVAVIASRLLFDQNLPDTLLGLVPKSISKTIQNTAPYFAPPMLFLLAMFLLFFGANLLFKDFPKLRHWQRISATVTTRNWLGDFTYSYTFDNAQFEGKGKDNDDASKAGKTIRIYVNPNAPSESDTKTPATAFFTGIISLIFGVAAILATVSMLATISP